MADAFDVVVIGAGPAGEVAAERAAQGGLSVALVERELLGGECSYWACVPSKALLQPGEVQWIARHAPGVRAAARAPLDAAEVLARRDAVVGGYRDDSQEQWARGAKLTVVRGQARLAGERKVRVEHDGAPRELTANKAVVLATGSTPRIPDTPGLKEAKPWDNRQGTSAKQVPARLVVVGGGPVGVELAQAWRSLGSREVTLVQHGPRLIPRAEPLASEAALKALRDSGITVRLGAEMKEVRRPGGAGEVTVTFASGESLRADEILVATGRRPRTENLGVETVGLAPGKPVEVDEHLRAKGVPGGWLYAIGDVNGRNLLTHMGKYQGRLAGDAIAGKAVRGGAWADAKATPQVIFTHPQVAWVGLTEEQARKAGIPVRTVQKDLSSASGFSLLGEGLEGSAKLVVDEKRRVIVGATFTGPDVGEMLHAATIAVTGEVPLDTLWHAVPAFPSVSEVWLHLLEGYGL
ncbi:NAD(P)/FAD-dependent oxidoreductase [Myxococcaceae bacterium GXIMD 01537]